MSRRWIPVAAVAVGCGLIVAKVAADHALAIQVLGAVAGATLTLAGVVLTSWCWPVRRASELRRLMVALGFFSTCVGVFVMGAGAGPYH